MSETLILQGEEYRYVAEACERATKEGKSAPYQVIYLRRVINDKYFLYSTDGCTALKLSCTIPGYPFDLEEGDLAVLDMMSWHKKQKRLVLCVALERIDMDRNMCGSIDRWLEVSDDIPLATLPWFDPRKSLEKFINDFDIACCMFMIQDEKRFPNWLHFYYLRGIPWSIHLSATYESGYVCIVSSDKYTLRVVVSSFIVK